MKKLIILSLIVLTPLFILAENQPIKVPDFSKAQKTPILGKLQPFELKTVQGKSVNLTQYEGKVVVVVFFATWCPPCMREVPDLMYVQKQYANDVVVLAISVDEDRQDVMKFMAKAKPNYVVTWYDKNLSKQFGSISSIPTSFIVDRKGQIVDKIMGYEGRPALIKNITKHF